MQKYDLIIIGGGAAGFAAAMKANSFGKKTLMINNNTIGLGGTCVNVGCLPTKHLLEVIDNIKKARENPFEGLQINIKHDFKKIMNQTKLLVKTMREEKYSKVLESLENIELIEGEAKFISENEVLIGKEKCYGEKFLISTGSSTFIPPIEGLKDTGYIDHITALELTKMPARLAVIGSGAISLEFSQIFTALGTKISIFEQNEQFLQNTEPEISELLKKYLEKDGIEFLLGSSVLKVKNINGKKSITFKKNNKINSILVDEIFIASGRKANTKNLNLTSAKVETKQNGLIKVNTFLQTNNPNIYAAGDVIGEPMLETIAAKEGKIATENMFLENKKQIDYSIVPRAIFTKPELASVGFTDKEAIANNNTCSCRTIPMSLVPKAQAVFDTKGAIKIVADAKTGKILGITILSSHAADLIHEAAMIIENKMTLAQVVEVVHVFPTLSEGIKIAAQSFFRDVKTMSCCVE